MRFLKQSTSVTVQIGPFTSPSDGYSAASGLSPSVKLSKNGGAAAVKNEGTTPTHDADGMYLCALNATDTNTLGVLSLHVAGSSSNYPVPHDFHVLPANIYDSWFSTDKQQVHVVEMNQEIMSDIADTTIRRPSADARANTNRGTMGSPVYLSLLGAVSKMVNKSSTTVTPGYHTVYEEDGTTTFGRQSTTTSSSADLVTGLGTGEDLP